MAVPTAQDLNINFEASVGAVTNAPELVCRVATADLDLTANQFGKFQVSLDMAETDRQVDLSDYITDVSAELKLLTVKDLSGNGISVRNEAGADKFPIAPNGAMILVWGDATLPVLYMDNESASLSSVVEIGYAALIPES